MDRPELMIGEHLGTQPVLVGNHDEQVVELLFDLLQIEKRFRQEVQLFDRLNLLIIGFLYDGTVSVYE